MLDNVKFFIFLHHVGWPPIFVFVAIGSVFAPLIAENMNIIGYSIGKKGNPTTVVLFVPMDSLVVDETIPLGRLLIHGIHGVTRTGWC